MSGSAVLIGLTGRRGRGADVSGMPRSFADLGVDVYNSSYAEAISAAGGIPVYVPQHVDPVDVAARLDGLLVTGGSDIDPQRYGATAEVELYGPDPERDAFEFALLDALAAGAKPVLGICRGLQLLNVHGGGTLHQHVEGQARTDLAADDEIHEVGFVAGSRMHGFYGDGRTINSLHHQAVDVVASGWEVTGRGPEGGVEAIELPGRDVVAVQWHPELLAGAAVDPLFRWFVDAAQRAV